MGHVGRHLTGFFDLDPPGTSKRPPNTTGRKRGETDRRGLCQAPSIAPGANARLVSCGWRQREKKEGEKLEVACGESLEGS